MAIAQSRSALHAPSNRQYRAVVLHPSRRITLVHYKKVLSLLFQLSGRCVQRGLGLPPLPFRVNSSVDYFRQNVKLLRNGSADLGIYPL
jgi:hypothetical protein